MPVRTGKSGCPDEQEKGEAPNDEVMAALSDQKEFEDQKRELEAMLADNDQNLAEA